MTTKKYNPLDHSIVQAFLVPTRTSTYEATDFHEALLFAIAREIGRVHFNRYQSPWDRWSDDPHIPGIHWRAYRYDCECPDETDQLPRHVDTCLQNQPHFRFEDVEFDWYKYPGRGMSVNKDMIDAEWHAWFDRCLVVVRAFDYDPVAEYEKQKK